MGNAPAESCIQRESGVRWMVVVLAKEESLWIKVTVGIRLGPSFGPTGFTTLALTCAERVEQGDENHLSSRTFHVSKSCLILHAGITPATPLFAFTNSPSFDFSPSGVLMGSLSLTCIQSIPSSQTMEVSSACDDLALDGNNSKTGDPLRLGIDWQSTKKLSCS